MKKDTLFFLLFTLFMACDVEWIIKIQVGDKARLIIPSDLAYGEAGAGGVIPANANLIFDIELVDVIS